MSIELVRSSITLPEQATQPAGVREAFAGAARRGLSCAMLAPQTFRRFDGLFMTRPMLRFVGAEAACTAFGVALLSLASAVIAAFRELRHPPLDGSTWRRRMPGPGRALLQPVMVRTTR